MAIELPQGNYRDNFIELVEVKGPGDKIQKNQLRWMAHFSEHTIPHRVIHVDYLG